MKFKKILILLSIGIVLLIIFNVTNTINNNASTKQPVKDNNYNYQLPDYYVINNHHLHDEANNFEYIFEQLSDFKKFKVNYANHSESTAIITIKYPNGKESPIYYIKPGEERSFPFINASKGYHKVRIDSQNPHLNLDGYLTIREYN